MASIVVPGLDLAPSVPSRIVTVDVIDMTEGLPAVGAKVDFILPQDLHARSDGKVLKAGTTTLELDANGHGEIRVPAYSDATRPDDWVILVKKHWAPYPYPIRVPAGATKISLASLEPPVEVNDLMAKYLLTDASATIAEGAQWGVNVQTQGNIANFAFTAPPGGQAWSKGDLTTESTLETLTEGTYRVRLHEIATALNLPAIRLGTIEVIRGGNTPLGLRTFRFTTDDRGTSTTPLQIWERATDNTGAFISPWKRTFPPQDTVASTTVKRIITSTNYEHPLEEGDLLIVQPSPAWFTDFGDNTVGETPTGWANRWESPATPWQVAADLAGSGGRVLRVEGTGENNRTGLAWTTVGTPTDVEMVVKYRAASEAASVRPTVRGSGTAGNEVGVYQYLNAGTREPVLARLLAGTPLAAIETPSTSFGWEPDQWFIARFRVNGPTIKVKQWAAHLPEPDAWNQEWVNGAVTTPGWVGFQRQINARMDVDWVGVATQGGRAPMKAV